MAFPCRGDWLLLVRPLVVTEYRTILKKSILPVEPSNFVCGPLMCAQSLYWKHHICTTRDTVSTNHWNSTKVVTDLSRKITILCEEPLFFGLEFLQSLDTDLWRINSWIPNINKIHSTVQAPARHILQYIQAHSPTDDIVKPFVPLQRCWKRVNRSKSWHPFFCHYTVLSHTFYVIRRCMRKYCVRSTYMRKYCVLTDAEIYHLRKLILAEAPSELTGSFHVSCSSTFRHFKIKWILSLHRSGRISLWGEGEWSWTEFTITGTTTGLLYQHRMMMDNKCGEIDGMSGREDQSTRRNPVQYRFVNHKSHMTWLGFEPGPPREEVGD
jgi:hypothetical protein